jgi:hypothetical protein
MQGYFQAAHFVVPSELGEDGEECHVDYTIVSRRSKDRAGLRYQRRGIDEEAHVANFVETETIMRIEVPQCMLYSAVSVADSHFPTSARGRRISLATSRSGVLVSFSVC